IFDAGFERTLRGYYRAVGWCLQHRVIILGVFLVSVALTIYFFMVLPTSFFPHEDIGRLLLQRRHCRIGNVLPGLRDDRKA
ncbi:efflux RND transporter permease subunit, partial [Rhizobium ruizarguesonis]